MSPRVREIGSGALTVLAAVVLIAALAVAYVRQVAVNDNQFADRATVALQSPAVRSLVARRVTDDLVLRHADTLLAARPLIEAVVSAAVADRAFANLFRAGVRDLHRAVFERDAHTVTLTVADAGTVAAAALDTLRPSLAKRLRAQSRVRLLRDDLGSASAAAVRFSARVRLLAVLLGVAALLCGGGAVALSRQRRRAITGCGVAIAVAGVLLVVAWTVGRTIVVDQFSDAQSRAAAGAVWGAFLGDLRTEAWILAGVGAVLAAAAASLIHPIALDDPLRRLAGRLVSEPAGPWARAVRAVALIAIGAACVLDRGAVIAALFTGVGVYLIYAGTGTLLGFVSEPAAARSQRPAGRRIPARRTSIAVLVAALATAAAVGGLVGSGTLVAHGPAPAPCDGSRALCDRPLNEVALPATHNAMSAPLPGWFSAEQEAGIPTQLRDGIRGLLIDTYDADRLANGRLRTDLSARLAAESAAGISPQARRAAERLRSRLGFSGRGRRGLYLCHGFCELGGTRLSTVLDQIHDFLVANPGQVLIVINEDYVAPRDFVDAVVASGLGTMAITPPDHGPWPTLRALIDSGRRVLFLAEHRAGAAPWYQPAYRRLVEETPYHFTRASQLTDRAAVNRSCRANRGPARGAPLFLVNNWVSTDPVPLPANAAKVNAAGPLLRRLRACERLRHHVPNLVAVNFYREGDLQGAVDALNGVGGG